MVFITDAIKGILEKSTLEELRQFVNIVDQSSSWFLLSDYCFEDTHKISDTLTFSLLLYHDKIDNIKEYIRAFQPKDIKKTTDASLGFIQYLNCPVIYHFSFILRKSDKFLSKCLTNKIMEEYIEKLTRDIDTWKNDNPETEEYYQSVKRRIRSFQESIKAKSFNWKLMRKIMINSCIASIILYEITELNKPISIIWISDRDGIVEKFDGISLDLAFSNFIYAYMNENNSGQSINLSFLPKIYFLTSKHGTIDDYEELVRIPDFIAGTVAELNGMDYEFRHKKYYSVFYDSIVNARNHSIIAIDDKKDDFYIRRIKYV